MLAKQCKTSPCRPFGQQKSNRQRVGLLEPYCPETPVLLAETGVFVALLLEHFARFLKNSAFSENALKSLIAQNRSKSTQNAKIKWSGRWESNPTRAPIIHDFADFSFILYTFLFLVAQPWAICYTTTASDDSSLSPVLERPVANKTLEGANHV